MSAETISIMDGLVQLSLDANDNLSASYAGMEGSIVGTPDFDPSDNQMKLTLNMGTNVPDTLKILGDMALGKEIDIHNPPTKEVSKDVFLDLVVNYDPESNTYSSTYNMRQDGFPDPKYLELSAVNLKLNEYELKAADASKEIENAQYDSQGNIVFTGQQSSDLSQVFRFLASHDIIPPIRDTNKSGRVEVSDIFARPAPA